MTLEIETETKFEQKRKQSYWIDIIVICTIILVVASVWFYIQTTAPKEQGLPITLEIAQGMSVKNISELAEEKQVVRSELLLYSLLTSLHDPTNIHAGRYVFDTPMNVFSVARKLANNEVDELLVTITIPEGITGRQIAEIADASLENFDKELFLTWVEINEGYLFPDTYFVPESYDEKKFFVLLSETFADKVKPLELTAPSSTLLSSQEVVILASIIEREANDEESMKMVSGILQNRLRIGMPLQADAAIEYVVETPLNELAPGELATYLQTLDSPYNTYKYAGLPPTPIGNPGLMAIEAVFYPTESDNLFYITGEDGNFYYAETLDEHNLNVDRYLR